MAQQGHSARIRTALWVLVAGLFFQASYEGLLSGNPNESIHLPTGNALRMKMGRNPVSMPRIQIVADVDLSDSEYPESLTAQAPLAVQQWQKVLDSLAEGPASRRVLVAHTWTKEQALALKPSPSWARLSFASLAQNEVFHENTLGNTGHLGPWSPYAFWPVLAAVSGHDAAPQHETRHLAFTHLPHLEKEGTGIRMGTEWLHLGPQQQLYFLHLSAADLAARTMPLRAFAQDPVDFGSRLQDADIVIVQERKLLGRSPSLEAEVTALASMAAAVSAGDLVTLPTWSALYLVLLAAATLLCALFLRPRHFLPVAVLALGTQVLVQPLLLVLHGTLLNWSQIAFVFLPAALVGGWIGMRHDWLTRTLLTQSLRPSFPEKDAQRLASVLSDADDGSFTRERLVTLVEVDVVGFAKTIENTIPEESTRQIGDFLNALFGIIHSHGGFVSDYSPDRVLAVFGHGLGMKKRQEDKNHVKAALACAKALQIKSVDMMHELGTGVTSPFPVRVAINSSLVRLGLVHIGDRLEFKTIGTGVALARQLAGHCEPFRILMSASSADLLNLGGEDVLQKEGFERCMGAADSPDLQTVFELDPFSQDAELLNKATELFRSYNHIKREDNRFAFPRGGEPMIRTNIGQFDVLDFSITGLRLRSSTFLTSGSVFQAWPAAFDMTNASFKMNLTVHWGAPDKASPSGRQRYFLGVRYSGHTPEELAAMLDYFHRILAESSEGVGLAEAPISEIDDWAS